MEIADKLNYIYAKSYGEQSKDSENHGITLVDHLKDVVQTTYESFDVFSLSKKEKEILILASLWHDMGKVNRKFQRALIRNAKNLALQDYDKFVQTCDSLFPKRDLEGLIKDNPRHELLSVLYFLAFNKHRFNNSDYSNLKDVINAIAWHHSNNELAKSEVILGKDTIRKFFSGLINSETNNDIEKFLNSLNSWIEENQELFQYIVNNVIDRLVVEDKEDSELLEICKNLRFEPLTIDDLSLVEALPSFYQIKSVNELDNITISELTINSMKKSGLLKRADYIASAFPQYDYQQIKSNFQKALSSVSESLKKLQNLTKNHHWQYHLLEQSRNNFLDKDLFMLQAPTGSGKTYFAYLLWAYFQKSHPFCLYILPYRAALNQKFEEKIKFDIQPNHKNLFDDDTKGLLHSSALLELIRLKDDSYNEKYENVKMSLTKFYNYPVIYATADQLMLTALEFSGCDLYVPLYSKSFVVLDEPQAYDELQLGILIRTIQIILEAGGKVLIMSATINPALEHILNQIFEKRQFKFDIDDKYEIKNLHRKRHVILIHESLLKNSGTENSSDNTKDKSKQGMNFIELVEIIRNIVDNKLYDGEVNKILITVNNVKKAIQIYKELLKEFDVEFKYSSKTENKIKIFLLHSRLKWEQKNYVINNLLESSNDEKWILVSTQVIEAAIDIDADFLITELAPFDILVQRFGRVYRNRQKDKKNEHENIIIVKEILVNENNRWREKIYDEFLLDQTEEFLKNLIITKSDKKNLTYLANDQSDIIISGKDTQVLLDKFYHKILDHFKKDLIENMLYVPTLSDIVFSKDEAHSIFREQITLQVVFTNDLQENFDNFDYLTLLKNSFSILINDYARFRSRGLFIEEEEKYGFKIVRLNDNSAKDILKKLNTYGIDYLKLEKSSNVEDTLII